MKLDLIPLLQIQRDLQDVPLGWTRFKAYIQTITGGTDDLVLPLSGMNPMGKPHVAEMLDALLAFDAEAVAKEAIVEARQRLTVAEGQFQVGLVATDDLKGGWTNRYFTEMGGRFAGKDAFKRGWLTVAMWTSEPWSPAKVRVATLAACYRAAYILSHGEAKTLHEMMLQEGFVALFAGDQYPALDPEELAYSREVIRPHRNSTNYPTVFACLYGDEAAYSVGYPLLGLSPRAGYSVAWEDAREMGVVPEDMLRRTAALTGSEPVSE